MISTWKRTTVGEVLNLQRGHDLTAKEFRPGPFPVISSGGFQGFHSEAKAKGPGVLLGRKGTLGTVWYTEKDYWPNSTTLWVTDFKGSEPRFVYYFFKYFGLTHLDVGSANPTLNRNHVHPLPVLWPPIAEQRAIAHILGTLDDKIELNRRMNETLEAIARALFKSWFVDYDPVRAKAEGRKTGLPPEIDALFPDGFEETEIGEVPRGWEVGSLSDLATLNPESWTKQTYPRHISYVDLSNTKRGRIEAVVTYEAQEAPSRAQRILRPGDTIIGTVRPGNESFALVQLESLTGSTGFAVLRPRRGSDVGFVYLCATNPDNIEALAHLADGAAYPAVRPEGVASTPAVVAPPELRTFFGKLVHPILERLAANEKTNDAVASMRDNLLPKLVSGELQVLVEGID